MTIKHHTSHFPKSSEAIWFKHKSWNIHISGYKKYSSRFFFMVLLWFCFEAWLLLAPIHFQWMKKSSMKNKGKSTRRWVNDERYLMFGWTKSHWQRVKLILICANAFAQICWMTQTIGTYCIICKLQ